MEELTSLVIRAQGGDLDAYGTIVRRFQDMAYGCGYSILGDFHLAEDAAQEAFIQAYRDLPMLREPAAFPGWFRRIVFKHCDRLARGKRIATVPLETVAEMASREPGPDELAEEQEMKDKVLDAIQALPEHERMVTTLFYINGYSQNEIATFLDVPVPTVKNRLRTSRKRLKESMMDMVEKTLKQHAPGEEFNLKIMKQLADELVVGLREQLPAVLGPDGSGIWSVCISGSYARGDFVPGNSSLDINIIFEPGSDATRVHDPALHAGYGAIRTLVTSLLGGRTLYSHNPHQFNWLTHPWEWIPKRGDEIHIPKGRPHLPWFSIFLFDFIENLLVLWGNDPRDIMPDPPDTNPLAREWFDSVPLRRACYIREDTEWRIPFSAFKSLQVAQIVFGERTLDKRRLLELYEAHVPEFPRKDFGVRMIQTKLQQRYPDAPVFFAAYSDYADFEDQLGEVVKAALDRTEMD